MESRVFVIKKNYDKQKYITSRNFSGLRISPGSKISPQTNKITNKNLTVA